MLLYMATGRLSQFTGGFDGNLNHVFINILLSYLTLAWNISLFVMTIYKSYYPDVEDKLKKD